MSLTSILRRAETRAFLKGRVGKPELTTVPEPQVVSRTDAPNRVGTAFDYALRAGLAARFDAEKRPPLARSALYMLTPESPGFDFDSFVRLEEDVTDALETWKAIGGEDEMSDRAASACYRLAALDFLYRASVTDDLTRVPTERDVEELQALYRIVPWSEFEPNRRLLLNPTFGEGSKLVGGADADVVKDESLVEVKTISKVWPGIKTYRQLVGYALLANEWVLPRFRGQLS